METYKIKNKLEAYGKKYQDTMGSFDGFLAIFDFVDFIKNEPSIKSILEETFAYIETQKQIVINLSDDELEKQMPGKSVIDINKLEFDPTNIIFKEETNTLRNQILNYEGYNPITSQLPISLTNLAIIHDLIKKAKDEAKGHPRESEELIKFAKTLPGVLIPMKLIDKGEEKSFSLILANYYLNCVAVVGAYIENELSANDFIKDGQPKPSLRFDTDDSILYIKGQEIKITLKNDKPIDHYILEAIFSKEDLSEQTDFVEIAEDTIKEDYNGNWQRFRNACDNLNQKIAKATDNKIPDFIVYTTGKTGWCKINHKYL